MNIQQEDTGFIHCLATTTNEALIKLLFELAQKSEHIQTKKESVNLYRKIHLTKKEILERMK